PRPLITENRQLSTPCGRQRDQGQAHQPVRDHDLDCASVRARETRTRARCSRYSRLARLSSAGLGPSAAWAAASAGDAPAASAASVSAARSGLRAILTRVARPSETY